MTPFQHFVKEFNKPAQNRSTIRSTGKMKYIIPKEKVNSLFDDYLLPIVDYDEALEFIYQSDDLPILKLIFRVHFKLWIEIDKFHNIIIIHKKFPRTFKIIEEVNNKNHWFTPKTFPKGTTMYCCPDPFGICNWMNGIPLSTTLEPIEDTGIIPVIQVNYDFIKREII